MTSLIEAFFPLRDSELAEASRVSAKTAACALTFAVLIGGTTSVPMPPVPSEWQSRLRDTGRTSGPFRDDDSTSGPPAPVSRASAGNIPAEVTVVEAPAAPSLSQRIQRLREGAGLTWDQTGKLFGVSRRAVHLWATGGRMNGANIERLGRLEAALYGLGADPDTRRLALFDGSHGPSPYDEFRAEHTARGNVISSDAQDEV